MTDDFDRRLNPFRYDAEGHLTEAARAQDSSLHLDRYDGRRGGEPSGPALVVTPALLTKRAEQCDRLGTDFERACCKPLADTEQAGAGLRGFTSAAAFADLAARWNAETQHVVVGMIGQFAADLRRSAAAYETQDVSAADSMHG